MRVLVSISLTLLFLTRGMDMCCELEKLPNLLEHYQQHKESGDRSFWQFLADHFVDTENHTQDHDDTDHQNLPFHGDHQCSHPPAFYVAEVNLSMTVPEHLIQVKFHFYNSLHSSELSDTPFQPPKA